ncbi:CG031-like protein [Mya arenaria]|uniref:CG031-like protein n=1 Tax=Mya arenaria TaxID=6604 RepID=A0ABY7E4E0_MYAAR|nr:uncharacterized protein LOC128233547 [Mya arenaria]XP_052803244.1 uncharacterized protein LOC128233557 [Mya arenaria]WAR04868.1 CG031-like protein [Mya arenaria]WAR04878.1 CG031-like protein [Mya arenaria]
MTSLELFRKSDHVPKLPKEWGTGKYKEDDDLFLPKAPTWQYSGQPNEQFYRLTQLKLSNVRSNDELVPDPHESAMGPIMVNKTFPSEHPYSSHMPRAALFPRFDSDMDPKRGVAARGEKPISHEMPAKAYDVQIVHKTKGFGDRREIQSLPKNSEKEGLEWVGEHGFNQKVKVHNGRQDFYPIPPKIVAPNLQSREGDMKVSVRTATAMRNVERDQWQTTYDRQHTGLGPANPNKLDNHGDKTNFYSATGITDDNIYPRSINTFDPPRPFDGRISKMLIPKPPQLKTAAAANAPENPNYIRMKTLSEREEHRLLNGKEYASFPDDIAEKEKERWRELEKVAHADPNLKHLSDSKGIPERVPYIPAGRPGGPQATYLESTKRDQDKNFQEMEAQNRWKVLEAHSPGHDVTALNNKMALSGKTERPTTFYGHEGKYNEERAGLYKTSYSPERLAYNMNALDVSGPEIMNTRTSHMDALNLPTKLNQDMRDAFRYSRTFNYTQPNLAGDRREPIEHSIQHNDLKEFQKSILQPNVQTARVKVQEGETILKDSTMGGSYNTRKFLQEQEIGKFSRYEPNIVMSAENQNLHNVRKASSTKQKNVKFSDNVMVAKSLDSGILRLSSAPTRGSPRMVTTTKELLASDPGPKPPTDPIATTQYSSVQALYHPENDKEPEEKEENEQDGMPYDPNNLPRIKFTNIETQLSNETKNGETPFIAYSSTLQKKPCSSEPSSEYRNEFSSKGTNFIPSNLQHSLSFESAYKAQFPVHRIGYKDDRFSWQPGHGTPRPQTSLLDIQNSFEKTAVRRNFLGHFSESNPDLRQNITRGKKHNFWGINGQLIHG